MSDLRLYCLPHAGGGALAFRPLQRAMPEGIEVIPMCPPGRDLRFGEPLVDDLGRLVRDIVQRHLDAEAGPFALYGHSMGSLVAFELVRHLQRSGRRLPCHLFVGARGAPALGGEYERLSTLTDAGFLQRLRGFGGMSEEVLASGELMGLMLPVLRNDFRLLDAYAYLPAAPLPVPLTSFHGRRDPTVRPDWVRAWSSETSAAARHHVLPAGHFFAQSHADALAALIADTLLP